MDNNVYDNGQIYVVAAGNEHNWYGDRTISAPGAAKNAITIGATYDSYYYDGSHDHDYLDCWLNVHHDDYEMDKIAYFSSTGPTGDGRMKPDVVAPGYGVISCTHLDNNGYVSMDGTSMATPHVSGLIATLLHHYPWLKGCPGDVKSWLLAKALAYKGNKNNVGNAYGFGKVDSYLTHWNVPGEEGWEHGLVHGSVSEGTWAYHDVTIPSDADRLVVVLTWIEEAADAGAEHALRNNIDLYLDKGADQGGCAGEWSSTSDYDNVEYVILDNPDADTYRVKICPTWLNPSTSQKFNVSHMIIRGDPTPTSTLTVEANKIEVNVSESFTVTATITPSSYMASSVYANISVPDGVNIEEMWVTRWDGWMLGYLNVSGSIPNEITLGDIPINYYRKVSWILNATTLGIKTIQCNAYSSNSGSYSKSVDVSVEDSTDPPAPVISSATHPDEDEWYPNNDPSFAWITPSDTSGIACYSYTLDQSHTTTPDTECDTTENSVWYSDVPDGIWYVHVRAKDNAGNWGDADRYRVKIDTENPPAPVISSATHPDEDEWHSNNDSSFAWITPSDTSGIACYSYTLDQSHTTTPDTTCDTIENSESYTDVADGIWYFHLRAKNNAGNWGSADHYKVKIGSGEASMTDAAIALAIAAGSREYDPRWDASGDGSVTSLDALMILQAAAGAIDL